MSEINLEKIDIIRERTGVTYSEAKAALEACDGEILDALIYLEGNKKNIKEDIYTTKEDLVEWIKQTIKKGNVTRIRVKKDDKNILDIPVNTGVAATGLAAFIVPNVLIAPLLAVGVFTAMLTKISIEITSQDGSVKVINKIVKNTVDDLKDKVDNMSSDVKDMFEKDKKEEDDDSNVYQYTVKFEDIEDEK